MLRHRTAKKIFFVLTIFTVVVLSYHAYRQPMDFRVYHYGANGVFNGTRPVYGVNSGLGWPMHYRYPPLFLLLFAPFAMLPLGPAAVVWLISKVAVMVWLSGGIWRAYAPSHLEDAYFLAPLFLIAPYIIEELRYGNAQFFIFALAAAALLSARQRPVLAGSLLALAISIKVWPLFFIPYLAVRRDWKVVAYALIFVLLLGLLPSVYFGVTGNAQLLGQWFRQEFHTQLSENEIWFPNQSLRGVMMRYLTVVDYSQVPDANYPQVNIAGVSGGTVRLIWLLIAGILYAGFLAMQTRRRNDTAFLDIGLAFCLVALLEPFTQKYALALLLWPAVAAVGLMRDGRTRILIYCATVLALIQPLAPGASTQRLLQVLGLDFAVAGLLAVAIFVSLGRPCNKTLIIQE